MATNPFQKKKVSQQEYDEIVRKAREDYNYITDENGVRRMNMHNFLIAPSEEHFVAAATANYEVEARFVEPEPMTKAEQDEFEDRIVYEDHLERLRIPIPGKQLTGVAAIDKAWKEKEDEEMRKFLAPARDAEDSLRKLIEETVSRALRKASGESSLPSSGLRIRPVPSREGIMPIVKAAAEFSENSDLTRFLTAFAENNEPAMRQIVRELEAA